MNASLYYPLDGNFEAAGGRPTGYGPNLNCFDQAFASGVIVSIILFKINPDCAKVAQLWPIMGDGVKSRPTDCTTGRQYGIGGSSRQD